MHEGIGAKEEEVLTTSCAGHECTLGAVAQLLAREEADYNYEQVVTRPSRRPRRSTTVSDSSSTLSSSSVPAPLPSAPPLTLLRPQVPYHSWRISHGRHHAATGHMTRDEVFVPKTRSNLVKNGGTGRKVKIEGVDFDELLEDAPIWTLQHTIMQQVRRHPRLEKEWGS